MLHLQINPSTIHEGLPRGTVLIRATWLVVGSGHDTTLTQNRCETTGATAPEKSGGFGLFHAGVPPGYPKMEVSNEESKKKMDEFKGTPRYPNDLGHLHLVLRNLRFVSLDFRSGQRQHSADPKPGF